MISISNYEIGALAEKLQNLHAEIKEVLISAAGHPTNAAKPYIHNAAHKSPHRYVSAKPAHAQAEIISAIKKQSLL